MLNCLDASKGLDRVNHAKLFHRLSIMGVLSYPIRILGYCYASQPMAVRWSNAIIIYCIRIFHCF